MVSKMQEVANKHNLDIHIEAFPAGKSHVLITEKRPDCVLLGPQVRFQKPQVDALVGGRVPVEVIDMRLYGTMNGKAVLERALELIK